MQHITGTHNIVRALTDRGVRGVIFDIDGTLLDSMPIWHDIGARYLRSVGKEPAPDLGEVLFPMTIGEGVAYVKRTYQLSRSEAEIRGALVQITERFYREEVQLKKGAYALLAALTDSKIPMVLATVGEASLAEAALRRLGVRHFFGKLCVCEEYHTTKREAKIYRICAGDLGTAPGHTLVVEDILQAIRSAHEAGFLTAGIADRASAGDENEIRKRCDFWFPDFSELYL